MAAASSISAEAAVDSTVLHAMVLGQDAGPRPMARPEIESLGDYFTQNVLLAGRTPMTLASLVESLGDVGPDLRLDERQLFLVAEGAPFASADPPLTVNSRLVYVWRRDQSSKPDVMLSTQPLRDDPMSLLQLIAWSETGGAFHFFERDRADGLGWVWAGNSFHALAPGTRGRGPFDSHVNGGLVMKELKAPWPHWQSQASSIPVKVALPDVSDPLFGDIAGAEQLQAVVEGGVRRWTERRLEAESSTGTLSHFRRYARHLVTSTTYNLVSSTVESSQIEASSEVPLPVTFFYDQDGLNAALAKLSPSRGPLVQSFAMSAAIYRAAIATLGLHVQDNERHRVDGETRFAFIVPERAFEDQAVIRRLMVKGLISPRLVISCLMVDFTNPIGSGRRRALLNRFSDQLSLNAVDEYEKELVARLRSDAEPESTAEELLGWYDADDIAASVEAAVSSYAEAVRSRLTDESYAVQLHRLADSRRGLFRRKKLDEFDATLPMLGEPTTTLHMNRDATITPTKDVQP